MSQLRLILDVIWNILIEEISLGLDHTLLCEALLSLVSCRLRQALPFTESSWNLQEGDRSHFLAQHSPLTHLSRGKDSSPQGNRGVGPDHHMQMFPV